MGLLFAFPSAIYISAMNEANHVAISGIVVPGLVFLSGIILLDEDTQMARFQTIEPATAQTFSLTEAERTSFNAELEEVNLIAEEAGKDLTAKMPTAQIAERYEGMVSKTTISAVGKIIKGTVGK